MSSMCIHFCCLSFLHTVQNSVSRCRNRQKNEFSAIIYRREFFKKPAHSLLKVNIEGKLWLSATLIRLNNPPVNLQCPVAAALGMPRIPFSLFLSLTHLNLIPFQRFSCKLLFLPSWLESWDPFAKTILSKHSFDIFYAAIFSLIDLQVGKYPFASRWQAANKSYWLVENPK